MGVRPGTNWTTEDLDYIGRPREERFDCWGTAEILTEYKNRISVGQPMDGISELGHLHRQLLQDDSFCAHGRTLLKKLSSEELNEKFIFDGRNLPNYLKEVLLTLEDSGFETSPLKGAIRLAGKDTKTLEWVAENWITFVDVPSKILDNIDNESIPAPTPEERGPRDSYRVVEVFRKSPFKESAERRLVHLKAMLDSIKECFTPAQIEKRLWEIRETYGEDRQLIEAWSPKRKEEDRKLYLTMLHRRRRHLEKLREEGKNSNPLDFESIRAKMWFCFDRVPEEKVVTKKVRALRPGWTELVDLKTGKIPDEAYRTDDECEEVIAKRDPDPRNTITEKSSTGPCLWEVEKSKAFCGLNQTRPQWNKIYDALWKKMGEVIVWRLSNLRNAAEGKELVGYIRKYRFRIDSSLLGQTILEKAQKAKTESGRNFIRLVLSACYGKLDKETRNKINREINKRRF